jgi:hypothetical protein
MANELLPQSHAFVDESQRYERIIFVGGRFAEQTFRCCELFFKGIPLCLKIRFALSAKCARPEQTRE